MRPWKLLTLSDDLSTDGSYENYNMSAFLHVYEAVLEIVDLPTRYHFSVEIEITHFIISCGGFSCYTASVNTRPILLTILEKYMLILSDKKKGSNTVCICLIEKSQSGFYIHRGKGNHILYKKSRGKRESWSVLLWILAAWPFKCFLSVTSVSIALKW